MTKKDYILISGVFKRSRDVEGEGERSDAIYYVARRLADELQKENARFDYQRFMDACGCTEATSGRI